jgi:hypothetical protein
MHLPVCVVFKSLNCEQFDAPPIRPMNGRCSALLQKGLLVVVNGVAATSGVEQGQEGERGFCHG